MIFIHTQPFYSSLDSVWDNPGEPVPEETFIHSHLSWSSIIPYQLPPSITIHGILSVQFTCLAVFFHNLSHTEVYLLATHLPFILYSFLLPTILIFAAHAHTIATCFAVVPRLCHLILKCHLIFLSYRPGLTSMHHTTSHTTAVQSPSHCQWYILIHKQWYQLPEFIPSNSNSGLHSCISISIYTQHVT